MTADERMREAFAEVASAALDLGDALEELADEAENPPEGRAA